jgi:hypothetical protein
MLPPVMDVMPSAPGDVRMSASPCTVAVHHIVTSFERLRGLRGRRGLEVERGTRWGAHTRRALGGARWEYGAAGDSGTDNRI